MLRVRDRYVIGLPSHSSPDTDGGWEEEDKNVLPLLSLNFSMQTIKDGLKKKEAFLSDPCHKWSFTLICQIYAFLSHLRAFKGQIRD